MLYDIANRQEELRGTVSMVCPKKKVLIIDDEEEFGQKIKTDLERTGRYDVRTEYISSYALNAAVEFKPDLILLDILMPEMDGSDVACQMRLNERTKDIPIVFLTAAVRRQETDFNGGIIGGHPFIAKPVSTPDLIYYIDRNIEREYPCP